MKQKFITDFFQNKNTQVKRQKKTESQEEKVYGYNEKTDSWHCTECGIDMGSINPRQLCGKIYCENKFI